MFKLFRKKVKQNEPELIRGVTLSRAMEGVIVLGGTGGGKTSGPGKLLALNLLALGCGGLVLCAKVDEKQRWIDMCARFGRKPVIWGPGTYYPFIEYELSRPGGGVMAADALYSDIVDAVTQQDTKADSNPFFPMTAKLVNRHMMSCVWLAKGRCEPKDLNKFYQSLPSTPEEQQSEQWQSKSFCFECIREAYQKHPNNADLELADDFFLKVWCRLGSKTASSVLAHVVGSIDPFMTEDVKGLVNNLGGERISIPELVLAGEVVIVDAPVLRMREPGRLCNIVAKVALQRAVLARSLDPGIIPVFLFADEANWFAIPGIDALAQSVARQSKFINVILAQNLPLFQKALGGDHAKTDLDGYIANFQTKVFCQNLCHVTNQYASDLMGQSRKIELGGSPGEEFDLVRDWTGQSQKGSNINWHERWEPNVRPEEFTRLRKGGVGNGFQVEAVVYHGKTWERVLFDQRI